MAARSPTIQVKDCKSCDGVGVKIAPVGGGLLECGRCGGRGVFLDELPLPPPAKVGEPQERPLRGLLPEMGATAMAWVRGRLDQERQVEGEVIDLSCSAERFKEANNEAANLLRNGCGVGWLDGEEDFGE